MTITGNYLNQLTPWKGINFTKEEKWAKRVYDHPTLIKILKYNKSFFIPLAISTPYIYSYLGYAAFGLGGFSLFSALFSNKIYKKLSSLDQNSRPMNAKMFSPGQHESGKLFYQGNIPILTLSSDDPYKAGKAYGFLLAKQILNITEQIKVPFNLAEPSKVPNSIKQIMDQIPTEYIEEMKGVITGVNQWIYQS